MDIVDHVANTEALLLEKRIEAARATSKVRQHPPKQECYFCGEEFKENDQRIYCDVHCGKDHERLMRR